MCEGLPYPLYQCYNSYGVNILIIVVSFLSIPHQDYKLITTKPPQRWDMSESIIC